MDPIPTPSLAGPEAADGTSLLQERRQTTRVDCCYQVDCTLDGAEFAATVINMGLGGMRFLAPHQLAADDLVSLRQPGLVLAPVTVRVVWARQQGSSSAFETGVVYMGPVQQLDSSWVKSALQRLGFEGAVNERRRHLRTQVDAQGVVHLEGVPLVCRVLDLGLGGALIQTDHPIPRAREGSPLLLEVNLQSCQDKLAARIVYMRNPQEVEKEETARRYGLCFDNDQITRALAKLVEGYLQARRH